MAIIVLGVYLAGKLTLKAGVIYIIPFVYSIPIITTSVVLSMATGVLVACIASVLFGSMAIYGFMKGYIDHQMIFMVIEKMAYFFIIAFLSGYLAFVAKRKGLM